MPLRPDGCALQILRHILQQYICTVVKQKHLIFNFVLTVGSYILNKTLASAWCDIDSQHYVDSSTNFYEANRKQELDQTQALHVSGFIQK